MSDFFTKLQDVSQYKVSYRPSGARPALWDCPKVIRDAAAGRPPELKVHTYSSILRMMGYYSLIVGVLISIIFYSLISTPIIPPQFRLVVALLVPVFYVFGLPILLLLDFKKDYKRDKGLFDAFASNPEIYRDEIFKEAVTRLSSLDFYGRHVPASQGKVGRLEDQVIEEFRKIGILQETTVENRGKPFLIHQYELRELHWGKWEDGGTKNYTLDLAILWPERRIKFDIEIDDPSHATRPLKDIARDETLTDRGWFVRRFNHKFIEDGLRSGKLKDAIKDVVGIIYFFAKYASNEPIGFDTRTIAFLQERNFRERRKIARAQRNPIVTINIPETSTQEVYKS